MVSEQQIGKDEHHRCTGIIWENTFRHLCVHTEQNHDKPRSSNRGNKEPYAQFATVSGTYDRNCKLVPTHLMTVRRDEWKYGSTHAQPWL
jgi:hypothetical protein